MVCLYTAKYFCFTYRWSLIVLVIIVDPGVKVDQGYSTYDNGMKLGVFIRVRTYVCMYVCMYVCTYVCIYVYMYIRTYVCMYVCMYVCTYVCMHVRSTYVCMLISMYVYIHALNILITTMTTVVEIQIQ